MFFSAVEKSHLIPNEINFFENLENSQLITQYQIKQFVNVVYILTPYSIFRYGPQSLEMYVQNVSSFCGDLKKIIHQFTCVIMTTSLPVSKLVKGGFLGKSDNPFGELLPFDQVLANHAAASIAKKYGFNILDLYFAMKGKIVNRNQDGVHWGPAGYREMTYYFIDILLKINPELRNF